MVRKTENYLTTYEKLARYLDLNYETVRRMLNDDERLMNMAENYLLPMKAEKLMSENYDME